MRKEKTASRRWKISSGRIGSFCRFSTVMNTNKRVTLRQKRARIAGWFHGSLTPPSSMGRRRDKTVRAKRTEPVKSMRASLLFWPSWGAVSSFAAGPGR
jgi:hypothetical protein